MCIVIAVLPTVLVYFSNMSEGVTENRSEKECSGVKYYDNNQKPPTCGMLYMCVCCLHCMQFTNQFFKHHFVRSFTAGSCCAKSVILGIKSL